MSIRMTQPISEPAGPAHGRALDGPAEPSHAAYRPTAMSTQQMSRGAVAAATAAMLGAAFWVGSHSGREASAAPLVSYPIATNPGTPGYPASPSGITVTGTSEVPVTVMPGVLAG